MIRIIIFLFCFFSLKAQILPTQGASDLSMAYAGQGNPNLWSIYSQPAQLSFLETIDLGISYHNLFLLKELSSLAIATALPFKSRHFVATAYRFGGYKHYQNHDFTGAYAFLAHSKWRLGLVLDYHLFHFSEKYLGFQQHWRLGIAQTIILHKNLNLHIFVKDFLQTSFQKWTFPALFEFALSYLIVENLHATLLLSKGMNTPFQLRTGWQYQPFSYLILRMGLAYPSFLFALGVGTQLKNNLIIDLGFAYHFPLGIIPSLSLAFKMPQKNKK